MIDSTINNDSDTYAKEECPLREEQIIAQKIYDQCRLQNCTKQGPAVSCEECECIIEHPGIPFGRIIFPKRPIRLPKWIKHIKYIKNSFRTKQISIERITPSLIRRDYWDVEIKFVFEFEVRLFGEFMTPVEILCCPCKGDSQTEPGRRKDFLCCSTSFVKKVTLHGTTENAPSIASDILPHQNCSSNNAPHVLVEEKAELVKVELVDPEDPCNLGDLFDDIYHEPFYYIFATIAMIADIKLFRFVCLLIEAKNCCAPKVCKDLCDDPCLIFEEMPFPTELFKP